MSRPSPDPHSAGGAAPSAQLSSGARALALATVAVSVVNYGYSLSLTHLLRPAQFAAFGAGQALLLAVGTVATSSVPWVLASALSTAQSALERRRAVAFAVVLNIALGLVAGLVVAALGARIGGVAVAVSLFVGSLLILLASTPAGWLQGNRRFTAAANLRLLEVVTKVVAGLALVVGGLGVAGALGGFVAGAALALGVGMFLLRHDLRPVRGFLRVRGLWTATLGIGSIQATVSVLAAVDTVAVGLLPVSGAAGGSYQAANVLARVPIFFGGAVAVAAFPLLASPGVRPHDVAASSYRLYARLALPYALVLATVPRRLLTVAFPAAYADVHVLLPALAVSGLCLGVVNLVTTFFQSLRAYRDSLVRQAAGLVVAGGAVTVGYLTDGIRGLAVGAAVGALSTAAALAWRAQRRWPHPLTLSWPRRHEVGWAVTASLLLSSRNTPVVWLPAAAAVGAWTLRALITTSGAAGAATPVAGAATPVAGAGAASAGRAGSAAAPGSRPLSSGALRAADGAAGAPTARPTPAVSAADERLTVGSAGPHPESSGAGPEPAAGGPGASAPGREVR